MTINRLTAVLLSYITVVNALTVPGAAKNATGCAPRTEDAIGPVAGSTPTFLVHGLNGDPVIWNDLLDYWSRKYNYHGPIFKFDYRDTTNDPIEDNAKKFRDFVVKQQGVFATPINIVAHSLGGLVARYAMAHLDFSGSTVKHLVTLATPNKGTALANWCHLDPAHVFPFCTSAIRELQTDSTFLNDLNKITAKQYNTANTMTWGIVGDGVVFGDKGQTMWDLPGSDSAFTHCWSPEVDGTTPSAPCEDAGSKSGVHNSITRKTVVLDGVFRFIKCI